MRHFPVTPSSLRYALPAALLLAATPAMAQTGPTVGGAAPAAPQGAAPTWIKICNTDPATKKEHCVVIYELRADSGQHLASAAIQQITGEPKMSLILTLPLGVMIQPGARVQVDGGAPFDIKFEVCFPNGCFAKADVNADFVNSMKGGNQLLVQAVNIQAKGLNFPMTLAGFTRAFDSAGVDQATAATQQDDLNKALQARAAEAKKKLIEQQQKEAGGTN